MRWWVAALVALAAGCGPTEPAPEAETPAVESECTNADLVPPCVRR